MDNRPEALVILSPGFPKNEADTACLPPQQVFVKALKEEYPDLEIVVLSFQYPFEAAEYNWHGVKITAFAGRSRAKFFRLNTWIKVWRKLSQLNRHYRITGLLSFWLGECAFIGHYYSKRAGIKHRCWMLGQDAKGGNKYVKWIKPNGAELIALSDFIVREFNTNYSIKPLNMIPVGIDAKMFKPLPLERDIDIIGAGSLIPLKQYHLFIEVVARLKQFYPDLKTIICGGGPERERLQDMINLKKLANHITLMGELPHDEVIAMMQRSKILFHPSAYEGFGAVCLEALYAGAKVVSFVKPMDDDISNWHIVSNMEQAELTIRGVLNAGDLKFESVLPYDIRNNVRKMMRLFG